MSFHNCCCSVAEATHQVATLIHGGDQMVSLTKFVADVPCWNVRSNRTAGVHDRLQGHAGHTEGDHVVGVVVNGGIHFGPSLIDGAMDHSLSVRCSPLQVDCLPVE